MQTLKNIQKLLVLLPSGKKGGMAGLVLGAISIVALVILSIVVNSVIAPQLGSNFTGINQTIVQYFVTFMLLGGLVVAGLLAVKGMSRR